MNTSKMQYMFVRLSFLISIFFLTVDSSKVNAGHHDFIKAINEVRRSKGMKPVCLSEKLNVAASKHSQWMGEHGKLIHGSNSDLMSRILKTRYPWNGAAAENIALNADRSVWNVVKQWVNSPTHYANIVSGRYNQVGVGAFAAKQRIWWTMVLAQGNDECAI